MPSVNITSGQQKTGSFPGKPSNTVVLPFGCLASTSFHSQQTHTHTHTHTFRLKNGRGGPSLQCVPPFPPRSACQKLALSLQMASQPFPPYCCPRAFKVRLWSLKVGSISVWFPENPSLTSNCGALFLQGPTSLFFQSFSLFVDPKILPTFLLHQSLHWMVYP